MSDEDVRAWSRERTAESEPDSPSARTPTASRMHARSWLIAYQYGDPADYGMPALPEWSVRRPCVGGIALAENDASEPFIRADAPMKVRR